MNAKEMFEKLGFKYKLIENFIYYESKKAFIVFNFLNGKRMCKGDINADVRKAIYMQLKEIGELKNEK